jgi:hypothetical protein
VLLLLLLLVVLLLLLALLLLLSQPPLSAWQLQKDSAQYPHSLPRLLS